MAPVGRTWCAAWKHEPGFAQQKHAQDHGGDHAPGRGVDSRPEHRLRLYSFAGSASSGHLRPQTDSAAGGTYIDNLALADRSLAELMRTLDGTAMAAKTTVIVCSDHSWRVPMWRSTPHWTKEDEAASHGRFDPRPVLMIHFPGQQAEQDVAAPFDEIRIHEIIEPLLRGQEPVFDKALLAGAHLRSLTLDSGRTTYHSPIRAIRDRSAHSPKPMPTNPSRSQYPRKITSRHPQESHAARPDPTQWVRGHSASARANIRAPHRQARTPYRCPADHQAEDCNRCWHDGSATAPASNRDRASCCGLCEPPHPSAHAGERNKLPGSNRSPLPADPVPRRGRRVAPDPAAGRANAAVRNGASASMVTIQGEMLVAKLLARNGPRGWYSHAWMSRADQSFSRHTPNR